MVYAERRAKLNGLGGAEVVALVPSANMTYFIGLEMHLSERPTVALCHDGQVSFILPALEVPQLDKIDGLTPAHLFVWSDEQGYREAFAQAIDTLGLREKTLGVDDHTMRVFELLTFLELAPALRIEKLGRHLLEIRSIKSADEIAALREAVRRSEAALASLLGKVMVGMTEREIAALLVEELRAAGCTGESFGTLVQTGENSAVPHGSVSDRVLNANEFLLIDFGGRFAGYPADITRTFVIGEPTDAMRRIHETVLAANRAAIAAIRPGVTCGEVDKAARDVIEAAGYGQYFTHRLGHGLGIEVHELPQIAANVQDTLQVGMVFTVEPGIYVPGVGGVRIEEDVVVTESGVEELTTFRRDWVV